MSEILVPAVHAIQWDGTNLTEIESKFELDEPAPGEDLSFSVAGDVLSASWGESPYGGTQEWALGDWVVFLPHIARWQPGKIVAGDATHVRLAATT
jgi:hypothetical protein